MTLLQPVFPAGRAWCGETDSSAVDDMIRTFLSKNQPRIGLIASTDAELQLGDNAPASSFNIHVLRFYLKGTITPQLSYSYQAEFKGSVSTLDLKGIYRPASWFLLEGGQFKPAFGSEFNKNEAHLPFVNRAMMDAAVLNPGRQRGIQLTGTTNDKLFSVSAGVYNGNGINNGYDTRISLVCGKVRFLPFDDASRTVELSTSMIYSNDWHDLSQVPYIENDRMIANGQYRIACGDFWSEGEFSRAGSNHLKTVEGAYADAGWKVSSEWEVLARFDWIEWYPSEFTNWGGGVTRKYIAGANWIPISGVKLQLNLERYQPDKFYGGYFNVQYAINDQ